MTEREQFEKKKVWLWGLKQAKKSLLKEYDNGDQHPNRRQARQPRQQQQQQQPQRVREFEVGENYGVEDLAFLNREYDRIDDLIANTQDLDLMNELMDKQDNLHELIEGLEAMQRMRGNGLEVTKKDIEDDKEAFGSGFKNGINKTSSLIPLGTGFKRGSPEALAHAEKMRKAREAKNPPKQTKQVVKEVSKARVVKGSEEAKALGKRLAEAKKKKLNALKAEQPKEEVKTQPIKGKPYYYIGDIPKGYREATEQEAIKNNKVSEYGKYKVDSEMLRYYKEYGILLNPNASQEETRVMLMVLKKKTLRALEDIEIFESKIDNPKHKDKHNEYKNKLEMAKDQRKVYNAMYNFYLKIWAKLKGTEYNKIKLQLPKKEVIKTTVDETPKEIEKPIIIDPRTNKPISEKERIYQYKSNEEYVFERDGVEMRLRKEYFDDDKKILPKYAKKLSKKNLYLHPKYYTNEDVKKYFFN